MSTNSGEIIVWVALLLALTVLGALPMLLQGINLNGISPSARYLPLVMVGMLVTSCSPTLAALLVAGLYPGAGGVRSITRQARIWQVPFVWYVIALIGPIVLLLVARSAP
jgi:hypothetical protein